jgi:hypothetical protein
LNNASLTSGMESLALAVLLVSLLRDAK